MIKIMMFVLIAVFSSIALYAETPDYDGVILNLNFSNTFCAYIIDLQSGKTVFSSDLSNLASEPLPIGSIIKIYSIIAKSKTRQLDVGETHACGGYDRNTPSVKKCWLKKGHGRLNLVNAIAQSCNTYFYYFAQDIDFQVFMETLKKWGISKGSDNWGKTVLNRDDQVRAMVGKMNILKVKPLDLMSSCVKLFGRAAPLPEEVKGVITDGMELAYLYGTAAEARKKLGMPDDLPVLCKTGTGVFEEDDKLYFYKTNGFFIGIVDGRHLVFSAALESTGAEKAAFIGLSLIKELVKKK